MLKQDQKHSILTRHFSENFHPLFSLVLQGYLGGSLSCDKVGSFGSFCSNNARNSRIGEQERESSLFLSSECNEHGKGSLLL